MERNLNIYFTKFSGFEFISQLENCLLVFDNCCEEIFNDKEFSKFATAGRHKKSVLSMLSIICFNRVNSLEQLTSTQQTKFCSNLPEISDIQQISYIGKKLNNINFLKDSYDLATKQSFGHLLIDLDPKTTDSLRYCSNIVPGPTIFYLPSFKAVITHLTNER